MAKPKPICSVEECNRQSIIRGYCGKHYQKFRKYGDPLAGKDHAAPGETTKWIQSIQESDDCIEWPFALVPAGYGSAYLNGNTICAHRLSFMIHRYDPGDLFVLHSCDNPRCCNPRHLRAGTHQDNMNDKNSRGRGNYFRGEQTSQSKIKEQDVRDIRLLYSRGMSQAKIGMFYELHQGTVGEIVRREIWKHVA